MKQSILLPVIVLALTSPTVMANKDAKKDATTNNSMSTMNKSDMNKSDMQRMSAIDIIQQDHDYIRQMISRLDKSLDSNVSESRSMYKNLKDFVVKHETMEQKVWYPELEKKNPDLKSIIADLKKQENDADKAMKEIDKTKDDKEWASKVKNFTKAVDNHAKNEESNLFPKVKDVVDQTTLEEIGEKLKKYRAKNNMNNMNMQMNDKNNMNNMNNMNKTDKMDNKNMDKTNMNKKNMDKTNNMKY